MVAEENLKIWVVGRMDVYIAKAFQGSTEVYSRRSE